MRKTDKETLQLVKGILLGGIVAATVAQIYVLATAPKEVEKFTLQSVQEFCTPTDLTLPLSETSEADVWVCNGYLVLITEDNDGKAVH